MSHHPAAVVVVATAEQGRYRGLTATSLVSVSLEPPLLLVCIDSFAATREAIARAGVFSVSMLSVRQEFIAERLAGRAPLMDDRWRELPHRVGASGMPIIEGCVGWFECRLEQVHPAGDHDIFVGLITAAGREAGEPLIYWDRAFWRLAR